MMTDRQEAIKIACATMSLVSHAHGFEIPNDGFCQKCPAGRIDGWSFRNSGRSLVYVCDAVIEKLNRDGYILDESILEELRELFVGSVEPEKLNAAHAAQENSDDRTP